MPSFAAALFSCALVIASGYFAGRVKVIRVEGEGPRALGTFIGRFSLPALLFKELATLSFASLGSVLLSTYVAVACRSHWVVLVEKDFQKALAEPAAAPKAQEPAKTIN